MSFLRAGAPLPQPTPRRRLKPSEVTGFRRALHSHRPGTALLSRRYQSGPPGLRRFAGRLTLAASVGSPLSAESSFRWRGHRTSAGWGSNFPSRCAISMRVAVGHVGRSALPHGAQSHHLSSCAQRQSI